MALGACFVLAACGGSDDRDARSSGSDTPPADDLGPATVEFVTFPSITRLTPKVRVEAEPGVGETIELEAARGEREGGQLVAWASEGEPRIVLEAGGLRSASGARIDEANVRTYIEQAMVVEQGSPAGRSGTYVDPLVPAEGRGVVIDESRRLLAWVDVMRNR